MTSVRVALLLLLVLAVPAIGAQDTIGWKVRGDTAGAPAGCSATVAIAAINAWFRAFTAADSAGLARVTPPPAQHFGVFSTGRFIAREDFIRIESFAALLRYARHRARQHERMTLDGVQFHGWRDRQLGFMPYYRRSADDLGPKPLLGIGKAGYACGRGIYVLNLAPRPSYIPGLMMRPASVRA